MRTRLGEIGSRRRLSRRGLLGGAAVAGAALAGGPAARVARAAGAKLPAGLAGTIGLQLYSVRQRLPKDLPGTLARVRRMGFSEVEVPAFHGILPVGGAELAKALAKAGLSCRSYMTGFEELERDLPKVVSEAETTGARYVVCPWIPHEKRFTNADCARAIDLFPRWGKACREAGLVFAYHVHGFEFEPSAEGTLMDTLIKGTPKDLVAFEADVFWIRRGGCDPVALFERHPGRFPLLHLKDIAKGEEICKPNGHAPDEASVPLGAGMIDWPRVLRAAEKAGAKAYFVEDEHPEAERQIQQSLRYLRGLRL